MNEFEEAADRISAHGVSGTSINVIEWSTRAFNVLQSVGIETLGDLLSQTPEELMQVKNCGKKTVREIREKLSRLKVELKNRKVDFV